MKFCRHDWHNHSTFGSQTLRHYYLRDAQYGGAPIVLTILSVVLGLSFSMISWKLFSIELLSGLVGVFTFLGFLISFMIYTGENRNDVWAPSNKSCVKCGIIRFDADKAQHKFNVKTERANLKQTKRDRAAALRRERCHAANDKFVKLQALRQKTQAKV